MVHDFLFYMGPYRGFLVLYYCTRLHQRSFWYIYFIVWENDCKYLKLFISVHSVPKSDFKFRSLIITLEKNKTSPGFEPWPLAFKMSIVPLSYNAVGNCIRTSVYITIKLFSRIQPFNLTTRWRQIERKYVHVFKHVKLYTYVKFGSKILTGSMISRFCWNRVPSLTMVVIKSFFLAINKWHQFSVLG